jgi:rubrerythrin
VARLFRAISFAERVHATNHLRELGGIGDTVANLEVAIGGENYMKDKINLAEAWQLAIQREQEARDFYEEMAGMVEDSALKNLFAHLIEQEENHKQLLEEEYEKMFTPEN